MITQDIELNVKQDELFRRALYGIKALSNEQQQTVCNKKKTRIKNAFIKSQKIINIYKQEKTNAITNSLISYFSPQSFLSDLFRINTFTDESFINTLKFEDLNISKKELVSLLYKQGILPKNFYEIE